MMFHVLFNSRKGSEIPCNLLIKLKSKVLRLPRNIQRKDYNDTYTAFLCWM